MDFANATTTSAFFTATVLIVEMTVSGLRASTNKTHLDRSQTGNRNLKNYANPRCNCQPSKLLSIWRSSCCYGGGVWIHLVWISFGFLTSLKLFCSQGKRAWFWRRLSGWNSDIQNIGSPLFCIWILSGLTDMRDMPIVEIREEHHTHAILKAVHFELRSDEVHITQ